MSAISKTSQRLQINHDSVTLKSGQGHKTSVKRSRHVNWVTFLLCESVNFGTFILVMTFKIRANSPENNVRAFHPALMFYP